MLVILLVCAHTSAGFKKWVEIDILLPYNGIPENVSVIARRKD